MMKEHSSFTLAGHDYPFKALIPIAAAFLLLQGVAEVIRCVICLRTGSAAPAA